MNATNQSNQSTQSDNSTFKGVTVNDARQNKQQPKAAEKPAEKTPEQKEEWAKVKDKVHDRMFPNAKKEEVGTTKGDKGTKEGDKGADKKVETKAGEKAATNGTAKAKVETKPDKTTGQKDSAKGDDGKQGETEQADGKDLTTKDTKSTKKEVAQAPVDYERLSTSVATATVKAINESRKEPAKVEDEVPEARRRDVAAIEHLEKTNPKYKGQLDTYKKFARAEADYVAKWEKENPGQKFDAAGDEHSDWYDKHEPNIDPEDITEARVELRAKAIVEKEAGSTRSELEKMKLERDIERSERAVPSFIGRNISLVASSMGESVAQALSQLKANETLEETDPAAHATLATILPELNNQTVAAARIFGTDGRAYDGKNPAHVAVREAAMELETLILEQPVEKHKNERGQTFVTMDKWLGMPDAERAKHWTVDADLTSAHLATKASEKAEQNYKTEREKAEKLARAYGFVKNGEAQTEQKAQRQEAEKEPETEERTAKVHSPSTSGRSIIQPGARTTPKTSADGGDRMLDRMFRR